MTQTSDIIYQEIMKVCRNMGFLVEIHKLEDAEVGNVGEGGG